MKIVRVQFVSGIELDYSPITYASIKDYEIVMTKAGMIELISAKSKRKYVIPMGNVSCLEIE